MVNCPPGGTVPELKRQVLWSFTQPLCVTVWCVGVGFSQRMGVPLTTVAAAGT
jgi:hypothetical protein